MPVKNFKNFFGVCMVFCKNNGLTEFLTVVNRQTVGHKHMKHFFNGVLIKYPFIQCRRTDAFRQSAVFIFKGIFIGGFVRVGKVVIHNTLLNKFKLGFYRHKINKITVFYRLRQFIAIGRNAVFKFKNLVGVFVYLVFWGGCKTDERRVKIIKNIAVSVINRAVRLIADNKVKMTAGEQLSVLIFYRINAVHHSLVG